MDIDAHAWKIRTMMLVWHSKFIYLSPRSILAIYRMRKGSLAALSASLLFDWMALWSPNLLHANIKTWRVLIHAIKA